MSGPKILIVEDESIVALDIKSKLVHLGYEVVGISSTGEEAIELTQETQPDLVLMDIRLGGDLDGIETAQQLRNRYGTAVVYLTAYADELTLKRAKSTEPHGYIVKPFDERELRSTLEIALYKYAMDDKIKAQAIRLQKIVSTVPEGIVLLDHDYRIVFANSRALSFLRILTDDVRVGDVIRRLGNQTIEQLLTALVNEAWHEIKSDRTSSRLFEVTCSSIALESIEVMREPSEWVLIIREVTREREVQHQLQVQDRLATVGQFAAGIAHDFNNILAIVTLNSQLIPKMEPSLSLKTQELLETIHRQARRASDMVHQLLDFSRVSGVQMQPFDLVPQLKEMMKMLERILPENIRPELIYAPDDYQLNGDPTQISQCLLNLALNARDAMPDGGEFRVALAKCSSSDMPPEFRIDYEQWILLRVSDTGTGIHPEILSRIFEPFFTTKAPGKGTGLGLAQVYGIVQQHEGHITVESLLGQGSTFSVYLPSLSHAFVVDDNCDDNTTPPIPPGNQQTILLVEDNFDVQQALGEVLELFGYFVLKASNGREALEILKKQGERVRLVVSDLIMPEIGGLELCRELRRNNNQINVIITTGYLSDEIREELKSLSVRTFLTKPVTINSLLEAIMTSL